MEPKMNHGSRNLMLQVDSSFSRNAVLVDLVKETASKEVDLTGFGSLPSPLMYPERVNELYPSSSPIGFHFLTRSLCDGCSATVRSRIDSLRPSIAFPFSVLDLLIPFLWKNARLLSSLGWCSSLGFATEVDADASESTSTEDQASYASASFAAPFPDAQPTG
ncbi:hypothetical protein ZIOFF_066141 [Zingiber officinale]|uniref:Uncharacterized protein n=1 Tax=Zingiber officinale TaxID=94328 RepID=A0A8J5F2B0_ZINOF|nr:hypothetical protein ZIOFF_066141 [Zingiber officinale]